MKLLKRIWHATLGKIFWYLYAPKSIANSIEFDHVIVKDFKIGDFKYKIVQASESTIFTNRVDNISLIVNDHLVPEVSWQFDDGQTTGHSRNKLLTGEIRPSAPPKKIDGSVASLLTGGGGNYNYYHWLYDSLSRLKLCEPFIKNFSDTKFLIPDNSFHFQRETLGHLGIDPGQQLSSATYNHLTCDASILTSHPNPDQDDVPKWIIDFLRDKFLTLAKRSVQSPFIYISRKDSINIRTLINENALIDLLNKYNFQIYELSKLSFKEQVSLFANAEIILGVHGAGLTNITFCKDGASVIELFSNGYQPKMYESISKNLNLNYTSFSCSGVNPGRNDQESSLFLSDKNLSDIEAAIQQLT